jgi:hypothetical protein
MTLHFLFPNPSVHICWEPNINIPCKYSKYAVEKQQKSYRDLKNNKNPVEEFF